LGDAPLHVLGRCKLPDFGDTQDDRISRKWLAIWLTEIEAAHWKQATDAIVQFPRAKLRDDNSVVFPIRGSTRSIRVIFSFSRGVAVITEVVDGSNG
jgi:hypothetical protein